ncbi:aminodeoxychorismate/anthranilate synthase component II [Sutterella sp.]|uniref:anthranilate synthase component II n=1 Tax=Sutterella sp. TaxID=1981025 RepID=UPI0026E0A1E5|nr:aminodeoxychorismate/anthranilate synthase component II [Sutterella sp.]MDO5532207.1 aminodeoxychorismate/anthranilate synthase component II [Sutterella sp.]
MKLFMLDNYDSFTYNLVQYFQMLGCEVLVERNDETTPEKALALTPDAVILSPGPGRPADAGILPDMIRACAAAKMPTLGVCLGHQGIGEVFGAKVIHAARVMHGKASPIRHDGKGLFRDLPQGLSVIRYHSLALEKASIPECLEVTAYADDGEIMGVRHRTLPIEGIQYHPESILTAHGMDQLKNFLTIAQEARSN